jgi:hypothetical protein
MAPKAIHYQSDGTGRDSYVTISSGGMHSTTVYGQFKGAFANSLRNYESSPHSFQRCARSISPKANGFSATTYAFRKNYPRQLKQLSMHQTQTSERLAAPKKII